MSRSFAAATAWFLIAIAGIYTAAAQPTAPTANLRAPAFYPDQNGDYKIEWTGWSREAGKTNLRALLADDQVAGMCGVVQAKTPCFRTPSGDSTLMWATLMGIDAGKQGPVQITLSDGGTPANEVRLDAMLSRYGPNVPRAVAIVSTVLLIGAAFAILSLDGDVRLKNGQMIARVRAMFINQATSTYSLSKLQLYIWLAASVSTYLYVLLASIMIRGQWNFLDLPSSIAAVAGISVSTSVLSSGIASVNGGPGSGRFPPTGADLVTSGGDVASERVQQLVWTLIAAPVFVVLAFHIDPATVMDVQPVPPIFLQLMGVSSAGYLGGIIARGPGPKISGVSAVLTGTPPYLTLSVTCSDVQTKGAAYFLTDLSLPGSSPVQITANLATTSTIDASGVATKLDLKIPAPLMQQPAAGASWQRQLTIRAADGEMAEWVF